MNLNMAQLNTRIINYGTTDAPGGGQHIHGGEAPQHAYPWMVRSSLTIYIK